jgi:hypothetical protein
LSARADLETSAQTGRPSTLAILVTFAPLATEAERRPGCVFLEMLRVCAMVFP